MASAEPSDQSGVEEASPDGGGVEMTSKKKTSRRELGTKGKSTSSRTAPTTCAGCAAVEHRLNTLIVWMAQSTYSPISVREAEALINEVGKR